MAAVLCLVLIPIIAAIGVMFASNFGESASATLATLMFAALAIGVFSSVVKMARRWENEAPE
jgi:predicted Na+-dependent transporter